MYKKEFEILLNKMLNKELERLRKIFRPYKRTPFLHNKVIIKCVKYESRTTLGDYKNTRVGEKMKFNHIIGVADSLRGLYEEYTHYGLKKEFNKIVRDTIDHELIHAFTYEEFEMWEDIKNSHFDYSPIFLSLLYWCGGESGHKYTEEFLKTELWHKVSKCKTYNKVALVLTRYYAEINRVISKYNEDNPDKNIYRIDFGNKPGTDKMASVKSKIVVYSNKGLKIKNKEFMALNIGFLIKPSSLFDVINKNFNNDKDAVCYKEVAIYKTKGGHQKDIIIRGNY